MIDYQIKTLDDMIVVQSEGTSRVDALERLEEHLDAINTSAEKYLFVEMFSQGKVLGAMAMGLVNQEPEYNRKFKSRKIKSGPYLLIDLTYDDFITMNQPDSKQAIDFNDYLKKHDYRMADIPFFEFVSEDNSNVRVYVKLK